MENIYSTDFSIIQFAEAIGCSHFGNDLAVARISADNTLRFNDIAEELFITTSRDNILCSILVTSGELNVAIDYISYNIKPDSVLYLPPFRILTKLEASEDFSGYILINSRTFLDETVLGKKPPVSISQLLYSDRTPYRKLSSNECNVIKSCIFHIEYYIKQSQHRLQRELLSNTLYIFILESANIVFGNSQIDIPVETSTKKTYIQKFLQLLIKHADTEHNPAFYADRLCISVQYLSLILKEVSGKTANYWIAGYLITRAKVLLRKPEMTLQQIAETLNFSDQSSFGKFFKKHTGISPKKYKEEHTSY